jgi:DNA-binding MarR family transcriptional regulator
MSKPNKPGDLKIPDIVCNGTALRKASRRVSQLYDSVLAPSGLRGTQFAMLMRIARIGRPRMSELATALVLDRSALAHNLKPLERDGLVELKIDPDDRRSRVVLLTEAGRERLREAIELWSKAQSAFERAYGKASAAELRKALEVLASPDFGIAFSSSL